MASASGLSLFLLATLTAPVLGNPTGGAVVAGAATIGSAGKTLTINQSTNTAIINWQQFSINSGETTKFLVPNNTSATLNRVTGGNPSEIYGTLQSNGLVYLINPSGIVVGPSGRIDTAGFLGSTLDVSNDEFLKGGDMHFLGDASSNAAIDNQGDIEAIGGSVYLLANQVSNSGTISAPQGNVGMAAASNVLFQQSGDQHLFVQPTPAGATRAVGVTNSGTVRAASAELHAAGGNAYALAINNTGSIAATGYKKINGEVYLTSDTGTIANSGTISAVTADQQGGQIKLASTSGSIINSGKLDASATAAGGKGGSITLKSTSGNAAITASGEVDAKGGQGGTGGQVELSGATVQATGKVDTTALDGTTGMFTIDPLTFTIAASGGDETGAQVSNTLQTTSLNLTAGNTLTIEDDITWTSGSTLTLTTTNAGSAVNIDSPISAVNGSLNVQSAGTITFNNIGTSSTPATVRTLTLNAAGEISILNSFLDLDGGNFMATGTGFASLTPMAGFAGVEGIAINNSTINAGTGNVTLHGTAGYFVSAPPESNEENIAGMGVVVDSSTIETAGHGSVSITGNGSVPSSFTSAEGMAGVSITGTGSVVSVVNGPLSITGTVNSGQSNQDIFGVQIEDGSQVTATGAGGTVSLVGNTSGSTAVATAANPIAPNVGVEITDTSNSLTTVSVATGGSLTIQGTGGTVDSSLSTSFDNTGPADGVFIFGGVNVTAGTGSTLSITGQGGSGTSTGLYTGAANGVDIGSGSALITGVSTITAANNGSIAITGTGGSVNALHNISPGIDDTPSSSGVDVLDGGIVTGTGNAPVTITGTGGIVTGSVGSSIGVDVGAHLNGGTAIVSSSSGAIKITGTGGNVAALGIGTAIRGFNGGIASVISGTGSISLMGTGGSGYVGSGDVVGASIPNYGTVLGDHVIVTSGTGPVSLSGTGGGTGTGGSDSYGVALVTVNGNDPGLDNAPVAPAVESGGVFTATSSSGKGILIDGTITGLSTTPNTDPINVQVTNGNLFLGPNAHLTDTGVGNNINLVAGSRTTNAHYIINNSNLGANVITVANGANDYLYSSDTSLDVFGGITAPPDDTIYNANFPASSTTLASGNQALLFFASGPGIVFMPSANMPTGPGDSGSNVVPPGSVPQNSDVDPQNPPPPTGGNGPPDGNAGNGSNGSPGSTGGLAGASGNGGQVGAGDSAQLGSGEYNNVNNPFASGALNMALGPEVQSALVGALSGDWSPSYDTTDNSSGPGGSGETILGSGDTVEIGGSGGVKSIPSKDAPKPLQNALGNGVLNNIPH